MNCFARPCLAVVALMVLAALAILLTVASAATAQFIDPPAGEVRKHPKLEAEDAKLAQGKRSDDTDVRCMDGGRSISHIERDWSLVISGPPRRRFYYSFIGTQKLDLHGTYEVKDGFAVFTGTLVTGRQKKETKSVRFGLNYAFVGEKVHFNVLRANDGGFTYRRQSFYEVDGKWQPDELDLRFAVKKRTDTELIFQVKAERRIWDRAGKVKKLVDDQSVTYSVKDTEMWQRTGEVLVPWLAPRTLYPLWADADRTKLPALF